MAWLATWVRNKKIEDTERTAIELRTLVTCLHLSGVYDQVSSPNLAGLETTARRISGIAEAYSGDGNHPRLAGVSHYDGRTNPMDPVDPQLRAIVAKRNKDELELEALRGRAQGAVQGGRQAAQERR